MKLTLCDIKIGDVVRIIEAENGLWMGAIMILGDSDEFVIKKYSERHAHALLMPFPINTYIDKFRFSNYLFKLINCPEYMKELL